MSIETPFLLTTNLESRSERAGDREILILFEISTATPEVLASAEKKVGKERCHKKYKTRLILFSYILIIFMASSV